MSEEFGVSNGVRQGGILSPHLFKIYLDDLSSELNKKKLGCNINGVSLNHLLYADDMVVLAPSPLALQRLIDECSNYASKHDIYYHERKSGYMCMKPNKMKDIAVPNVYLYGKPIRYSHKEKYLGVIMNDNGYDDDDILRQLKGVFARGNILIRKFALCSTDVKSRLFNSYCSGLYCAALWGSYRKNTLQKLKVAYNMVFRKMLFLHGSQSVSKCMLNHAVRPFPVM